MTYPISFAGPLEWHPDDDRHQRRKERPMPFDEHTTPAAEAIAKLTKRVCPTCPDGAKEPDPVLGAGYLCPSCGRVYRFADNLTAGGHSMGVAGALGATPSPPTAEAAPPPAGLPNDMAARFRHCMAMLYPTGSHDMEPGQHSDLLVAFAMGWGESILRHGTRRQFEGWGAKYGTVIQNPGQPVPPEFHW